MGGGKGKGIQGLVLVDGFCLLRYFVVGKHHLSWLKSERTR